MYTLALSRATLTFTLSFSFLICKKGLLKCAKITLGRPRLHYAIEAAPKEGKSYFLGTYHRSLFHESPHNHRPPLTVNRLRMIERKDFGPLRTDLLLRATYSLRRSVFPSATFGEHPTSEPTPKKIGSSRRISPTVPILSVHFSGCNTDHNDTDFFNAHGPPHPWPASC